MLRWISIPLAHAGADFIGIDFELTFTSGSSNNNIQCAFVSIIDDSALEGDEGFYVLLFSRDLAVIIENFRVFLRILNDDS